MTSYHNLVRRPACLKSSISVLLAAVIALPGCTSVQVQNSVTSVTRMPTQKNTITKSVMSCVSDMLADYRRSTSNPAPPKPVRIALVSVKDSTNVSSETYPDSEIPSDMTDMALSVMSTMGGPIRIVHVPQTDEYLDAARAGSNEQLHRYFLKYLPSHYRGDTLLLYGALTEYDRFVNGRSRTAELSAELGNGQYETQFEAERVKIRNMARMTMDFRIVHPGVGDIVNHSSSSNTLTLFQNGRDKSFGLSVDGNSIGYSKSKNEVDARHHALRMLVELGVAEALGKYFYLPYWKCYPSYNKRQLVKFLDLTTMPQDETLLFSPFNIGESTTQPVPAEDPGAEEAKKFRDDELILSVMTNYLYGEYLYNGTRHYELRSEDRSQATAIKDKKVMIDGLTQMRTRAISMYKRNISRYSDLPEEDVLGKLVEYFREQDVLRPEDDENSVNAYLALWLNAPVARHASRFH